MTLGNNVCQTCVTGFAVGSNGLCEKSQNNNGGGGAVTIIINDPNRDPNCKEFINNKCSSCSNRYYLGS